MKTVWISPPRSGILEWLEWGEAQLSFLGEAAREECEQILEVLLGVTRPELYLTKRIESEAILRFRELVEARRKRVPLAYLLGRVYFWDAWFEVEKGVLTPRPETEGMIENFLEAGGHVKDQPFRFLDLGTGSGNIALTLARLFSKSRGVASDISEKALSVARRNAERLKTENPVQFIQADGLSAFEKESFDVIFSNPPYVAEKDWNGLDPEVREEPRLALMGGEEGLDFYRRIAKERSPLRKGGSLWVEVGFNQAGAVQSLFKEMGFDALNIFKDLNGIPRIVAGIGLNS